ncbi:MAG: ester cyclase [Sulfurimonadaceae bacterium]|nr:ester cyclase [Sulfurimonadaceae bacterium]
MDSKQLITAYYDMWNEQDFSRADKLLDPDIRFRGSLDIVANGLEGFKEYAQMVITAFPNLYHAIEMAVHENDMAAVYVTYTGTHSGPLFEYEPTGNRICYSGASFFHFRNGKIININVLGDLNALHKQLQ